MIEIDELEIARYDKMFGTKSKYFPCSNTIVIETPLDSWQIKIINRQIKPICLLHKNKFGRTNKFHIQAHKTCLLHAYDSINSHKRYMPKINNIIKNTYQKDYIK